MYCVWIQPLEGEWLGFCGAKRPLDLLLRCWNITRVGSLGRNHRHPLFQIMWEQVTSWESVMDVHSAGGVNCFMFFFVTQFREPVMLL
jgi:hypothetical protein